jgi:hypothetical protein
MTTTTYGLLLAVLGLASIWAARIEIAEAWRPGTRLQAMAAQVIITGGTLAAADFVPQRRLIQIFTAGLFLYLLVLIGIVGDGSRRPVRRTRRLSFSAQGAQIPILMATWAWLYAVNIWFAPPTSDAPARVASGVTLLLFLSVQGHRPMSAVQFYCASLITISALAVALPLFPSWFGECDHFKCNALNAILHGPFVSGNILGVWTATCAALLLASTRLSARMVVVLVFLSFVVYAVYSRTAQIAVVITALFVVGERFIRASKREPLPFGQRAAVMALLVSAVPLAIGLYFVFGSNPSDFSSRGDTWARGREAVSKYVLTGRGIDSWHELQDSGLFGRWFRTLFTHSEPLLIYFSGGVIALVLFFASMYSVTYASILRYQSLARGAAVPLAFGILGLFEAVWNPLTVDESTWVFLAIITGTAVSSEFRNHPAPRRPVLASRLKSHR